MNRPTLALAALTALVSSCEIPAAKPFFCGKVSIKVRDDAPSGDVRLRTYMHQNDSEPASMNVAYTLDDGATWHPATVSGEVQDVPSSPDDERNDLVWDSEADLGKGTFDNVVLRAVAFSECGAWDNEPSDPVTVDNSAALEDGCTVAVETPDSPSDGSITLNFTLSHPDALPAYVAPLWSDDGGRSWSHLTLIDGDCDGDGVDDTLSNLTTSDEGVAHCLQWDSQLDFASDESVLVQLSCGVGYSDDSVATTDAFDVENDPKPDAKEVIITELQPDYASAGDYIELYNRTNHILNLNGLDLLRWKGAIDDTEEPKQFTFDDPTGSVLIYPHDYMVLASTDDETDNGCIEPDVLWGSSFSLSANSTIRIQDGDDVLTELAFIQVTGRTTEWVFNEGVSYGLDPDALDSNGWDSFDNWCEQTTPIAGCDGFPTADLGLGTPGVENDACP